jgi:hypothetical protein
MNLEIAPISRNSQSNLGGFLCTSRLYGGAAGTRTSDTGRPHPVKLDVSYSCAARYRTNPMAEKNTSSGSWTSSLVSNATLRAKGRRS